MVQVQAQAQHQHFLFVTFPAQGHINPALQLAERLTTIGVHVTFLINTHTRRKLIQIPSFQNFTLSEFSDGYDDGSTYAQADDFNVKFKECGSQAVKNIVVATNASGTGSHPITSLVYCLFVPWAADLARECRVLPVFLWVQPAIVFDIYYHYFNQTDNIHNKINESEPERDATWSITFPKLLSLPLTKRDIPSVIKPTSKSKFVTLHLEEHFETLGKETKPKVLVNTFDALEPEALSAMSDYVDLVAIGPLNMPSGNSAAINLFKPTDCNRYISWLNTKPKSSVVYIAFGSLAVLSDKHVQGIKRGLIASGKNSLWVTRNKTAADHDDIQNEDEDTTTMVVSWCDQHEVLSHPSVGCFLTHCGWNSTLESMVAGKPMVALPQMGDQVTNAMLVELWKIGVRVNAEEMSDEEDLARAGDEIKRCLDAVLGDGESAEEIRRNAIKYRALALGALSTSNGSSDKNLRIFVDQLSSDNFTLASK